MLRFLLSLVIFCAFVVWVDSYIGWKILIEPWREHSPSVILTAFLLYCFSYVLRAIRVYDYFKATTKGQFGLCLRVVVYHNVYNNYLPMRSGEIAFPVLMSRYFSLPISKSIPALLWFRVLDLHFLVALATIVLGRHWLSPIVYVPIVSLWLVLPACCFLFYPRIQSSLAKREHFFGQMLHTLVVGLPDNTVMFWRSWVWTVANWSVKLAILAWIFGLFADLPYGYSLLAAIGTEATSALPIHGLAGVGTYEAGAIVVLMPLGVTISSALQGAVNLHLFILGSALLSGVMLFLFPRPMIIPVEPID